jgi:hypothetical protein
MQGVSVTETCKVQGVFFVVKLSTAELAASLLATYQRGHRLYYNQPNDKEHSL